jgi:predicted transcriptional regulator
MKLLRTIALLVAVAIAASAQKDFLTADEIDKVREAQEPNQRLQLYVLFARQRIDQLKQAIAKEKKGRSLEIRELLEQYAQIIDAIDMVSDDALKRKVDIAVGAAAVSQAEKTFLGVLSKVEANKPHDFDLYDVAFKDALENTKDSIDQASSDLVARQQQVIEKSDREKEAVKSVLSADEVKERAADQKKVEAEPGGRKPPTLYRKGEKPEPAKPPQPQP